MLDWQKCISVLFFLTGRAGAINFLCCASQIYYIFFFMQFMKVQRADEIEIYELRLHFGKLKPDGTVIMATLHICESIDLHCSLT